MAKASKLLVFNFLFVVGMLMTVSVSAQTWMSGFNYRKSISINKAQVSGAVNLVDFPVLISLTDPDLKYLSGQCNSNKLFSAAGLDISFASASAPQSPLKFQLDKYDPATGTLSCWVNIPVLSAAANISPNTAIYIYYGSNTIHDPFAPNALATWSTQTKLWHMSLDASPAATMNAKFNSTAEMARGTGAMNAANFASGKIGAALKLNGTSESMNAAKDTSTTFTISAWIKMNRLGVDQVLISNDSAGVGGYTIKVNASGQITIDVRKLPVSTIYTASPSTPLLADEWYLVAISRKPRDKRIYINGKIVVSVGLTDAIGSGGQISIGRGKQNDRFFSGMIDELRMSDQVKTADWLKTEYNNQSDPATFYVVGNEEKNPVYMQTGYVFTAALNDRWWEPSNWNLGRIPEAYANVVVKASGKVTITDAPDMHLNQLTLENGASLTLQNTQLSVCKTQLNETAALLLTGASGLQFNGDVLNNGLITTSESSGAVSFSGSQASTALSGKGSIRAFQLLLNQDLQTNQLNLNQPVVLTGKLELRSGVLNTNGKLTLAATKSQAASLLPISNLNSARVVGDVTVEKYIDGAFPSPATARGWRLWSSPVYTSELNGSPRYDSGSLKNAMFVTGKGGAVNGFDDSPQNGNTIFTHDQSIAGNLSQKYIPVASISQLVPLGTGIYVYSRGFRGSVDAFNKQVLIPPFPNPEAYTIRYTGKLFSGDLKVLLSNRNRKEPGDGFNLLGNPYASPLRWGSLMKENTTGFVWTFNPLNNSYDVTDDPNFSIPTGAGFFVKVIDGSTTGSLTFREDAKSSTTISTISSAKLGAPDVTMSSVTPFTATPVPKLEVVISRDDFSQRYILKLDAGGTDEVTDLDALSLGDGYVNLAGLSSDQQKLMVDSRGLVNRKATVPLYVKGWSTGPYELTFSGFDSFQPEDSILLVDKYANSSRLLTQTNNHYPFQIDADAQQSQGPDRFSLSIRIGIQHREPNTGVGGNDPDILIYPNPFTDLITMKAQAPFPQELQLIIRDLMGKTVLTQNLNATPESSALSINAGSLTKGMYILELRDKKLNKRLKTAKIIKL
jgi:hypothetical protein